MTDGLKTPEDVEDFIRGVTLLGTGGGGRPASGRSFLFEHIRQGKRITWHDPSEIPDDDAVCVPFFMGSIAPRSSSFTASEVRPKYGQEGPLVHAVKELEQYTGSSIRAIVPFEPGASNTPGAVDAAVRLGISLVDGDCAGRAVPELAQATPLLHDGSFWPTAICDQWGNVLLMKTAASPDMAEEMGKMISTVTKRPDPHLYCGFAGFMMTGAEAKAWIVHGTLSRALGLGRAIRKAREGKNDPVEEAIRFLGGWRLFEGQVVDKAWENREGYMYGTTTIQGTGRFDGEPFKIWFKNENHIAWKDGCAVATSPDLIMVVHLEDAEPVTNADLQKDDVVAVVGCANKRYRSEMGLKVLGPEHFGFEIPYVPIEERMESSY